MTEIDRGGWQAIHQLITEWREEARSKSLDPEYQDAWKKADALEAALPPATEPVTFSAMTMPLDGYTQAAPSGGVSLSE